SHKAGEQIDSKNKDLIRILYGKANDAKQCRNIKQQLSIEYRYRITMPVIPGKRHSDRYLTCLQRFLNRFNPIQMKIQVMPFWKVNRQHGHCGENNQGKHCHHDKPVLSGKHTRFSLPEQPYHSQYSEKQNSTEKSHIFPCIRFSDPDTVHKQITISV